MEACERLGLFQGVGIELEYMIVDSATLDVKPIADRLLADAVNDAGLDITEVEREGAPDADLLASSPPPSEIAFRAVDGFETSRSVSWSNELTAHVIEMKVSAPAPAVTAALGQDFQRHVAAINRRLAHHDARLMGGGMHPWMDPLVEKVLWPHGNASVYQAFDRIFDCRGHGWANLQSMHINLPFSNDAEFGRLHAAIRVLLPILPAIAASTPFMDGRATGTLDNRLAVYKHNAHRVPSVSGRVIPEPAFTEAEYSRQILEPMFLDIEPHDHDGILRHEWLNSRGAIARFSRGAIEIRVLDVQEHPGADVATAALVVAVVRALCEERWSSSHMQQAVPTDPLVRVLDDCILRADMAVVDEPVLLAIFGLEPSRPIRAGDLWQRLFTQVAASVDPALLPGITALLDAGSLARRLLRIAGLSAGTPVHLTDSARRDVAERMVRALATGTLAGV